MGKNYEKYQESISQKKEHITYFFHIQDNCGRFPFTVTLENIFANSPIFLLATLDVLPILRTSPSNKGKKSLQVKECPSNILSDVLNEILISYKAFSGRTSMLCIETITVSFKVFIEIYK